MSSVHENNALFPEEGRFVDLSKELGDQVEKLKNGGEVNFLELEGKIDYVIIWTKCVAEVMRDDFLKLKKKIRMSFSPQTGLQGPDPFKDVDAMDVAEFCVRETVYNLCLNFRINFMKMKKACEDYKAQQRDKRADHWVVGTLGQQYSLLLLLASNCLTITSSWLSFQIV